MESEIEKYKLFFELGKLDEEKKIFLSIFSVVFLWKFSSWKKTRLRLISPLRFLSLLASPVLQC